MTGIIVRPAAHPSRRRFLAGVSALGAGTLLPGCQTTGSDGAGVRRIDVHHHFAPPEYSKELKAIMRAHASWSAQGSLEEMDKSGIATAFLSLINPARSTRPARW